VEDLVAAATKDPVPGKITFIIKVIKDRCDFKFTVENIRPPSSKHLLAVHLISSSENFELYEIDTNSIHKKIAIHMMIRDNDKPLCSTKEISFANRSILLDLSLSFDFVKENPLTLNDL
jgi:hypothetical protein